MTMNSNDAPSPSWYDLAADDVICDNSFDRMNKRGSRFKGRQLWEFVEGPETRSFLNAIFFSVRVRQVVFEMACRSDGLGVRRDMLMRVSARPDKTIRVTHRLRETAWYRSPEAVPQLRAGCPAPRCSVCGAVEVQARWIDPSEHEGGPLPFGRYKVCCTCRKSARHALTAASQPSLEMTAILSA
jgi:hypothetical protein